MDFKITRKIDNLGRIVLPSDIRKLYGISPNDHLTITVTEKGILISKENA